MTQALFTDLPAALRTWRKADPKLAQAARSLKPARDYGNNQSAFDALVESLIHQQVSIHAGRAIRGRLFDACGGRITPARVRALGQDRMATIGLSRQKRAYILDLADKIESRAVDVRRLARMPDAEVIESLTQVKGIGVWTAKMFLIFHLERPDVVAPEDLGLRLAVRDLYKVPIGRTERFLERRAADWSPFGSLACLALWHSREKPTA